MRTILTAGTEWATIFWLSIGACGVGTYAITEQWRLLPIAAAAEDDCATFYEARVLDSVVHDDTTGGVVCYYRL
jgi:hypothetical protein